MRININQIVSKSLVCPYCLCQVNDSKVSCCGESRAHFETGYLLYNGEIRLASELTIDDRDMHFEPSN